MIWNERGWREVWLTFIERTNGKLELLPFELESLLLVASRFVRLAAAGLA